MADDAQAILAPVKVDDSVKAGAWEAYNSAQNETDLQVKLMGMKGLPDNVKADLWEAKKKGSGASQVPDATSQARQTIANIIPNAEALRQDPRLANIKLPQGVSPAQVAENENDYNKKSGKLIGQVTGTMATGGLFPALKGAGLLKNLPMLAGRAAATGAGAGAGDLAGGGTPQEAGVTALAGAAGQPIGEAVGAAVPPLVKWMTSSKSLGAKLLQQATQKAGQAPIQLSPETDKIVDEIVKQGKLGGTVPKVVTDLLDRVGPTVRHAADANPGPLTYEEARILQSNAGELSAQEKMDLKGRLKYLIPQFAKSFGKDVQAGADAAGIGSEHALGMKEYASASSRNKLLTKAGKGIVIGAGAYGALKELQGFVK